LTLAEIYCPKGLPLLFIDKDSDKEMVQVATRKGSGICKVDYYTIEDLLALFQHPDQLPKLKLND
jgi:hypothetical protein